MSPIWRQVTRAVASFVQAVPDGDELDVRLFSGGVRRVNAPVPASPSVRASWSSQLVGLPSPSGARTDLGAALDQALSTIESAPPNRQHFIYLITDGAQDPSASSPYPVDGGGNWAQLRARASALASARPLSFAIVRLTSRADEQGLLSKTLPQADVVPAMSSAQLDSWFSRQARSIALRKLKLRIAEERRLPAFVDSVLSPVRLGSSFEIRRHQLRHTIDAILADSAVLILKDGGQVAMHPTTTGDSSARLTSTPAARAWYLPPSAGEAHINQSVPAHMRFEPAMELQRIGISGGPLEDSLQLVISITGPSWWRVIAYWMSVVLLIAGVFHFSRRALWSLHRPRLDGRVRFDRAGSPSETIDLASRDIIRFEIRAPSGPLIATLEARNERGRTAIWIVPDIQPVTFGGQPLRSSVRVRAVSRIEHSETTVFYFPWSGSLS